jgi:ankyrin repeat protein
MEDDYGFGLTEYKLGAQHAFGHDGSIDGFNSIAAHFPEDNTTFCYLSNGTVWGVDNVGEGAAKIFYGHDYDIPDFKRMALPIAIRQFSDDPKLLERVKRVLNEGADIDAQSPEGDTALILVGWLTTNLLVVHYLIEQGADANIANENGDTALIDAAYLGKNNILKILLDNGAEVEAKNKRGQNALFMAREQKNEEAIELLREAAR